MNSIIIDTKENILNIAINDAYTAQHENKIWNRKMDDLKRRCSKKKLMWVVIQDAFIFETEKGLKYLESIDKNFLEELRNFFHTDVPPEYVSIISKPVKSLASQDVRNKRIRKWYYKNYMFTATIPEIFEYIKHDCSEPLINVRQDGIKQYYNIDIIIK